MPVATSDRLSFFSFLFFFPESAREGKVYRLQIPERFVEFKNPCN
jgi:hypothetical protein